MHINYYTFTWEGIQLPLSQAIFKYLGGVDPRVEWQSRGLTGYEKSQLDPGAMDAQMQSCKDFLATEAGQNRLKDFLAEASQLLRSLLSADVAGVTPYLAQKTFVFVVGPLRTGGTYLYTQLSKAYGVDYTRLNQDITHDGLPQNAWLMQSDQPTAWLYLAFELAQFLVWVRRECAHQQIVLQKNTGYGYALKALDGIFADQAVYVLSVRHPGPTAASIGSFLGKADDGSVKPLPFWATLNERERRLSGDQYGRATFYQKAFLYWESYYEAVACQAPRRGRIIPLSYGDEYAYFVEQTARAMGNSEFVPEVFRAVQRPWAPEWPTIQNGQAMLERMAQVWSNLRMVFPKLEIQ